MIRTIVILASTCVFTFLATARMESRKQPTRILLDESHSEWELSTVPFDENAWGRAATYNFAGFASFLKQNAELTTHERGKISSGVLDGHEVVVLKTPTRPYLESELRALHDFVTLGGAVWVIGDHTNLFGMTHILNRFLSKYGMQFNSDAVYVANSGWLVSNRVRAWGPRFATAVGDFQFQTSCSIQLTGPEPRMLLEAPFTTGELADYSTRHFFGDMKTGWHDHVGIHCVAAESERGKGKVLAFSDSTTFSNFSLHEAGVQDLISASLERLGKRSRFGVWWRAVWWFFAVTIFGYVLFSRWSNYNQEKAVMVVGASAASACGLVLGGLTGGGSQTDQAAAGGFMVLFPTEISQVSEASFVEEAEGSSEWSANSLGHASRWLMSFMRLEDTFCSKVPGLQDAIERDPEAVLLFNPNREPTHEEAVGLMRFVGSGGRLILVDDLGNNYGVFGNAWASIFGLSLEPTSKRVSSSKLKTSVNMNAIKRGAETSLMSLFIDSSRGIPGDVVPGSHGAAVRIDGLSVVGGTPFVVDDRGGIVLAVRRFGKGHIAVYTSSSSLSNAALGGRYEFTPDKDELELLLAGMKTMKLLVQGTEVRE